MQAIYGKTQVLPMVMVQKPDGAVFPDGLTELRRAIEVRVQPHAPGVDLETQIFDSHNTLERLCLACGEHIRELMQMM
ncbi:hypothetical protein [Leptodesmis sp.]|uniref:hypothetical protein n=1 Tax=Leptodesmis sp. TaxID=3100501 RepID=UPI0040534DE1